MYYYHLKIKLSPTCHGNSFLSAGTPPTIRLFLLFETPHLHSPATVGCAVVFVVGDAVGGLVVVVAEVGGGRGWKKKQAMAKVGRDNNNILLIIKPLEYVWHSFSLYEYLN